MQIDQILVMGEAQLAADVVDFFVGDFAYARIHRFYAKGGDTLLTQPAGGGGAEAGAVGPIGRQDFAGMGSPAFMHNPLLLRHVSLVHQPVVAAVPVGTGPACRWRGGG